MSALAEKFRIRAREYRALLVISLPLVAGAVGEVLTDQWDTFLQGQYSTVSLAAISVGGSVLFGVLIILIASMIGQAALSAHSFGANRPDRVGRVLWHSLVLYGALGVALTAVMVGLPQAVVSLFNCDQAVCDGAADYLRIRGSGTLLFILYFILLNVFVSDAKTKYAFYGGVIQNVLHIVTTTPLVFGWWIFPELGLLGSATGGLVADVLASVFFIAVFFREKYHVRIKPTTYRISAEIMYVIVKLGLPTLISVLLIHIAEWSILAMIGLLGTDAFAAGHLVDNLVFSGFAILYAFAEGGQILAGRYLGAGRWPEVKFLYRFNMELIFYVTLPIMVFLLAVPAWVLGIYTNDRDVVELGVTPLRIGAFMLLGTGWALNSVVFVRGLGKTLWDLITNSIGVGFHIAAAYVLTLALGWGLAGVFAAGIVFWTLRGAILLLFLRQLFRRDDYDIESTKSLDERAAQVRYAD